MTGRARRIGSRVVALAIGVAAALLLAEVAARVVVHARASARLEAWRQLGAPATTSDRELRLGDVIRPSADPGRIYELLPELDVDFVGVPVRTDAFGCRGERLSTAKPARTVRIVTLGDSVMFGWGVDEEASFVRVLQRMLETAYPEVGWQVLNTAVPGYNTAMQVATLAAVGVQFAPDLVLMDFVDNDLDLPSFVPHVPDVFGLHTSFLAEWIVSTVRGRDTAELRPLSGAPRGLRDRPAGIDAIDAVPAEFRYMVGIDGLRTAIDRLVELGIEHDFEVVVASFGALTADVQAEFARHELVVADSRERFGAYLAAHAITVYDGSELTLSAADPHPSALAHRMHAEEIFATLERAGVVRDAIRRVAR